MRPYLEVKVVKVKGKRKYNPKTDNIQKLIDELSEKIYQDIQKKKQPKGNWVNGENLDKIKFPCFCSFMNGCTKCYGEINKSYDCGNDKDVYEISNITKQVDGSFGQMFSVIYTSDTLQDLIKYHDIHILKGKIILFEEE